MCKNNIPQTHRNERMEIGMNGRVQECKKGREREMI